ncbi:MAG TPA: uroporphyrinogen-III synthase [Chitinophagaceae bacterium]|nr:uroporphyrinogen-III synthase [Chitinophagaceae bacterium]
MPQNKVRVLCTRNLDQLLISKAAAKNIFIDAIPFIKTESLETGEFTDLINKLSSENIIAIITSVNAAEGVFTHTNSAPNWKIFCTGGATKEYIKKHVPEKSITGTAKNASLLAEKIIKMKPAENIYFFCGDQRLNDLPEKLRLNNMAVTEIVSYKTIQTPVNIEEDYDGIMFFSPSAVHSFFSLNTIHLNVTVFAIGITTAQVIHTYCINKTLVSEWPGAENMTMLTINYFEENKLD